MPTTEWQKMCNKYQVIHAHLFPAENPCIMNLFGRTRSWTNDNIRTNLRERNSNYAVWIAPIHDTVLYRDSNLYEASDFLVQDIYWMSYKHFSISC